MQMPEQPPGQLADEGAPVPTDEEVIEMAREEYQRDGEIEIDDGAVVSAGDDNGAYVAAWVWVSYCGTKFDKEEETRDAG